MNRKRKIELVVISDLHLGTPGCHAQELLKYLKSIHPGTLVLNGDIVDIWQFRKKYFPKSHLKVVKHLIGLASANCKVYYITGNHDELFRKMNGMRIGQLRIQNEFKLKLDGKNVWFFHGDVFDVVMQHSRWIARLGAIGYDGLIWLNNNINLLMRLIKMKPVSFSKKIKQSVKGAVKFINTFEDTAARIAVEKGIETVVCGHIHQPENRSLTVGAKEVQYLNSGDWIENLTALEYNLGEWRIFSYRKDFVELPEDKEADFEKLVDLEVRQLFENMLVEFRN